MTTILLSSLIGLVILTLLRSLKTVVCVAANTQQIHYKDGKLVEILDSGRFTFWGLGHSFVELDTRLQPITLQTQELTTAEGLSIKVTVVGLFQITDAKRAVSSTTSFHDTLYTMVQLALRDLITGRGAEELITEVREFGPKLLSQVKDGAANLGLDLQELAIRDIILPAEVKSALSAEWRQRKETLAELEQARGKVAVTRALANSTKLFATNPELLTLKYFETLEKMSSTYGNTFVVGLPDDTLLAHKKG